MGAGEKELDGRQASSSGENNKSLDVGSAVGSDLVGEDEILGGGPVFIETLVISGSRVVDRKTPVRALGI